MDLQKRTQPATHLRLFILLRAREQSNFNELNKQEQQRLKTLIADLNKIRKPIGYTQQYRCSVSRTVLGHRDFRSPAAAATASLIDDHGFNVASCPHSDANLFRSSFH